MNFAFLCTQRPHYLGCRHELNFRTFKQLNRNPYLAFKLRHFNMIKSRYVNGAIINPIVLIAISFLNIYHYWDNEIIEIRFLGVYYFWDNEIRMLCNSTVNWHKDSRVQAITSINVFGRTSSRM